VPYSIKALAKKREVESENRLTSTTSIEHIVLNRRKLGARLSFALYLKRRYPMKVANVLTLLFVFVVGGCSQEIDRPSKPEFNGVYIQGKFGDFKKLTNGNTRIYGSDFHYLWRIRLNGYKRLGGADNERKNTKYNCMFKSDELIGNIAEIDGSDFKYIVNRGANEGEFIRLLELNEYHYPEDTNAHFNNTAKYGSEQTWFCAENESIKVNEKTEDDTHFVSPESPLKPALYSVQYKGDIYVFRVN
jgi:hypothetical protein